MKPDSASFFGSSLTRENQFQDPAQFRAWFRENNRPESFHVREVPLAALEHWRLDPDGVRIAHDSGRFFRVEGIHVRTNFGGEREWDQPIINQPEIGFLGFITRVCGGVRYFLVQAKMEPGNINTLQLSPSLQATRSNFMQVHKGKRPLFLEYFNGEKPARVLTDQLQAEQGGRFFRKRNRNIVVEIEDDLALPAEFCWLTLGELKALLREDNIVNMDSRSVLSTMSLIEDDTLAELAAGGASEVLPRLSENGRKYLNSFLSRKTVHSIDGLLSWYTGQKTAWFLDVDWKPLSRLEGWRIGEWAVEGDPRFFSVIGVDVEAGTREVAHWMQPLIKDVHTGMLAFVCQEIDGVLHFLVQAKVEPGHLDIIELSPTVSCSNYADVAKRPVRPFLFDELFDRRNRVHYDTLQSEEGGRFYQWQNRNMIVELPPERKLELPEQFAWMSLGQMKEFMRYGLFSIEARSIISSISFVD